MPSDVLARMLYIGGRGRIRCSLFLVKFQSLFKISAPPTGEALSQMNLNLCSGSYQVEPFYLWMVQKKKHFCISLVLSGIEYKQG